LLPCIVFFFSRAQVEALAHDVDKKWTFIGDSERKQIKDFVKNLAFDKNNMKTISPRFY
jgi:superfamily II RNA helicase